MFSIVVVQCPKDGWYVSINTYGWCWFNSWQEVKDAITDYLSGYPSSAVSILVQ